MNVRFVLLSIVLTAATSACSLGADDPPVPKGLRVLSTGNSFSGIIPNMLKEVARSAEIKGHVMVEYQGIGGSRVIQHWDLSDEKNKAKKALLTGDVDVMTMNPIFMPDDGIAIFVKFGLEKNRDMRFVLQQSWLVFDQLGEPPDEPLYAKRRYNKQLDRNSRTVEEIRKEYAPVLKALEDHAREVNKQVGRDVVFIAPIAQASILLREKIIAREAPDLNSQSDLFIDQICHPSAVLQTLGTYCYYAVIYRRSPVGLPLPSRLPKKEYPNAEKLNRLLQELAWQAVLDHPLSGVKEEKKGK
jgi:hypothetical protein